MIIISSDKQYRHDRKALFCEPNLFKSYENRLNGDNSFEYKFYYDRELTKQQVIELLEQTDEQLFFDSYVLLEHLMTKKIFEKEILAPFKWQRINKPQANMLFSSVDRYATLEEIEAGVEITKRQKVWKQLDDQELVQKIEKCIYIVDFLESDGQVEVIFGIHQVYDISQLRILSKGLELEVNYHERANRLNSKVDFVMYSFKIDADQSTRLKVRYSNCKLMCIKDPSVKKNTKGLYPFAGGHYMSFEGMDMVYFPRLRWTAKLKREIKFLRGLNSKQMIVNRALIYGTKPLIRNNKILVSDRVTFAKDNGEEFYRYLMNQKVRHAYYILSADSPDYERLKNEGFKIIKQNSLRHMLYLYNYKLLCTSNMSIGRYHYFNRRQFQDYADIPTGKNIFLQHGTAYNDLSKVYSDYRVDIDEFVCSAQAEYDFLSALDFRDNLLFTGAPRFDRLHQPNDQNYILAFFTWRENMKSMYSDDLIDDFTETEYFQAINRIMTDQDINNKLKTAGLELKLFLHPNMQDQAKYFENDNEHQVCSGLNADIFELIHGSKMLITDYSSVACDFAYQHKPVIAYQFDKEDFHYQTGIDLAEKQIIASYEDYAQAKQAILDCIDNQFVLSSTQQSGIDEFFGYRDAKNNERLYEYLSNKYL